MRSVWIVKMKPGMSEAAVRDVGPINNRSPLMAVTAVQALCNSTKQKLPAATIQERPVHAPMFNSHWGANPLHPFRAASCFKRLPMSLPLDLDLAGPIELQLDAAYTAPDTAFIAILQDVDEVENAVNITAGYLRAGLREVDEVASRAGASVLPCVSFQPVPIGERVIYRISLVPNARRFRAGHKLRLCLTTDDQNKDMPAPLDFRHSNIGTSSFNTVFFSSRLLLPLL
jgi:hypothetical protein